MNDLLPAPSPKLMASLRKTAPHGIRDAGVTRELWLICQAYAAGWKERDANSEAELQKARDEELEACVDIVRDTVGNHFAQCLRAKRRPQLKPPSLKELALNDLDNIQTHDQEGGQIVDLSNIRLALEQLPE